MSSEKATNEHSGALESVREFLRKEQWAVYRVKNGRFFGDTYFGPMWKDFPDGIDASGLELDSYREVKTFLDEPFG